ncbi:MAG: hypothetical protein K5739_05985 [Lachnospiraceae bacterium]|nr:hypothetical protein [Lachnospiraceae bacterium]
MKEGQSKKRTAIFVIILIHIMTIAAYIWCSIQPQFAVEDQIKGFFYGCILAFYVVAILCSIAVLDDQKRDQIEDGRKKFSVWHLFSLIFTIANVVMLSYEQIATSMKYNYEIDSVKLLPLYFVFPVCAGAILSSALGFKRQRGIIVSICLFVNLAFLFVAAKTLIQAIPAFLVFLPFIS